MPEAHQPWTPDFAERFDTSEVSKEKNDSTASTASSGKKLVGSDHKGLCRRPPSSSQRR